MTLLAHTLPAFAVIAYAFANPIVQRTPHFDLPKSYAALGDSFSAGLGSGNFLNISRDGADVECIRQDGSYPNQLLQIFPGLQQQGEPFDFVSCTGDELEDIDGQVAKLNNKKFDLITLTIGGNDAGFGDIVLACVYAQALPDVNAQEACDATLAAASAVGKDPSFWANFAQKLALIKDKALAPGGHLFVTGYGRFFDDPVDGDACDKVSFFPIQQLAALNMTAATRRKANELTDLFNSNIEKIVNNFSKKQKRSWWKDHQKEYKNAKIELGDHEKQQIQFINFDKLFEGRRFCEAANAADPIGSNNPNVFFNDLLTILAVPGIAPVEEQTPGLGGVDITDQLQQISVFHPKGAAPYVGLTVEIALRILLDAADSKDIVVGPAEYCFEKKDHAKYWPRDNHEGDPQWEKAKKQTHHCYKVPDKCALVKTGQEIAYGTPKVVCKEGKWYEAERVHWKDEWDW